MLSVSGCATVDIHGVKVQEGRWKYDSAELKKRFAFETHCDAEPEYAVLDTSDSPPVATTIGLAGCGRRAVYKFVLGIGWTLNSSGAPAK